MNRRRILTIIYRAVVLALSLLVVGGVFLGVIAIRNIRSAGSERQFARSDSPDGRYSCLVTEKEPEGLKLSPYIYTFSLVERSGGKSLSGKPYVANTDEVPLKELRFDWSADRLTVLEFGHPGPIPSFSPILRAYMGGGVQRWTRPEEWGIASSAPAG